MDLEGYNWRGFIIAFILLSIIPVWIINLFPMSFIVKIGLTALLGAIVFVAVYTGGTKRGFVSR